MLRTLLLAALLAAPLALAHVPPAPDPTCQPVGGGAVHDYLPPVSGVFVRAVDGNLANCGFDSVEAGVLREGSAACAHAPAPPPVCGAWDTGIDRPLLDYDGEVDHGYGGAILFVDTGDGASSGVEACHGAPSIGHHTSTVYAQDALGHGPAFAVLANFARPGLEGTPDCGDNFVEPCQPAPPAPSAQPFPVNVVEDTVNAAVYAAIGPGGPACNPSDGTHCFPPAFAGPSGGSVGFGPGADGTYIVVIQQDLNTPGLGTAGHIWTN